MMRWFWKRWVWAGVFGTTLVVGLAAAQKGDAPPGVPKVGDVITLKFANGPDRQVKVIKSDKQPDGSYLSEVKDTKTGETFSLLDRPGDAMPPAGSKSGTAKAAAGMELPKMNAPKAGAIPAQPKKEKERRFFPGISVFSPRPDTQSSGASPVNSAPPTAQPEEEEKPGLLKRIFGSKKTQSPPANAMPATTMPATTPGKRPSTGPAFNPGSNAAVSPPVRPTPYVARPEPAGKPAGKPTGSGSVAPPLFPSGTPEPPRSKASDPLAPPAAVIPVPVHPPTAPPSSSPAPLPLPSATVPVEPPASVRPRVTPPEAVPIPAPPVIVPAPVAPKPPVNPPTAPEMSKPAPLPEVSKPAPLPVPSAPAPSTSVPAIPSVPSAPPVSVPAPGGLPTIPVPPGGLSAGKPAVIPAAFAGPAKPEMDDLLPLVNALRSAEAPSKRALAARAMAGGRHGAGATAKSMLLGAAQDDPCGLVRAVCIEELCKLGHQDAAFLAFLKKACDDPSAEVSAAAKDAMGKMTPRK